MLARIFQNLITKNYLLIRIILLFSQARILCNKDI